DDKAAGEFRDRQLLQRHNQRLVRPRGDRLERHGHGLIADGLADVFAAKVHTDPPLVHTQHPGAEATPGCRHAVVRATKSSGGQSRSIFLTSWPLPCFITSTLPLLTTTSRLLSPTTAT